VAAPAGQVCRNCGAPLREGATFCSRCGTPVVQDQVRRCQNCGREVTGDDVFCPYCGVRLPAAAPAAAGAMAGPIVGAAQAPDEAVAVAPVMEAVPVVAAAPVAPVAPVAEGMPAMPMAPVAAAAVAGGPPRLELASGGSAVNLADKDEVLIGREDPLSEPPIFPDVDLTPFGGEEGGVSRRHARILRQGGDYLLEDLQSTNYTKLNGQRLAPRTPTLLVDGSRVDFGRVAMIFRR